MPTIHLEAEVSRQSLLKAIEQLTKLDQLVIEVLSLQDDVERLGSQRQNQT